MADSIKADAGEGAVTPPPELRRRWKWMLNQYARERSAVDLAHAIARQGEQLIEAAKVLPGEMVGMTRTVLLLRMISGLNGLCMLAAFGFVTEAKALHRSLLDALIRLRAICEKPDLLYEFLAQESTDNERMMRDFKQFQDEWGDAVDRVPDTWIQEQLDKAAAARAELEAEAGRPLKKKNGKGMNEWDWAAAGKTKELFWAHYALRSQSVHHSPRDLQRHLVKNERGEVYAFLYGPERESPTQLILDATKALTSGIDAYALAANIAIPQKLAELDRVLTAYYAKVAYTEPAAAS